MNWINAFLIGRSLEVLVNGVKSKSASRQRHTPRFSFGPLLFLIHMNDLLDIIESSAIRATKLVDGLGTLKYEEILRKLKLPTLKHRRKKGRHDRYIQTLQYVRPTTFASLLLIPESQHEKTQPATPRRIQG